MFIYKDFPMITAQNTVKLIITSLVEFLAYMLLVMACRRLDRYKPRFVVPPVLIFSISVQAVFILLFPTLPTADMEIVNRIAEMFLSGNYTPLEKYHYLYMHPQNLGISLFIYYLYSFLPNSVFVPKMANVLFSALTSLLIFLIYRELNGDGKKNEYGILVASCLYLPSILLNNLIYNDVIATSLFAGTVLFAIKFVRTRKIFFAFLCGAFLSVGNVFRSVGPIFLLAVTIYFLFNIESLKRTFAAVLLVAALFAVPSFAVHKSVESRAGLSEPIGRNSAPVLMWVHMGMSRDTIGFWDRGKSYEIYAVSGWNKELSSRIYKEKILENIKMMGIRGLLELYCKKTFWVWTEGTYQSELYGFGYHSLGGYLYETGANRFLDDASEYRGAVRWAIYVSNFLMFCLIAFSLSVSIKKRLFGEELLVLVILGFTAFYIIWEIKSRYLYPCFPYLLIMSYMGIKRILPAGSG